MDKKFSLDPRKWSPEYKENILKQAIEHGQKDEAIKHIAEQEKLYEFLDKTTETIFPGRTFGSLSQEEHDECNRILKEKFKPFGV